MKRKDSRKKRGKIGKETKGEGEGGGKEDGKAGKVNLTFFKDGGRRERDLVTTIAGSRRR